MKWVILRLVSFCVAIVILFGCTSLKSMPEGVTLLRGVDPNRFESPLWSPDGSKIVGGRVLRPMPDIAGFGSNPGSELFLVDLRTEDVETLLKEKRSYFWPIGWTQESQNIIINSDSSSFGSGCFFFDLQTSTPKLYSEEQCRYGFSPGGIKSAHFQRDYPDYLKLVVVNEQMKEIAIHLISIAGYRDVNYSLPSLSPDGKNIIFSLGMRTSLSLPMNTDIYIFDVERDTLNKYISDPLYNDDFPAYSPDGKFIAYYIMRFTEKAKIDDGVIVTRIDKSCQWRLPISGSFDWSPDSTKLVISADDGVYIVDLPEYLGESFVSGVGCP